MQKKKQYNIINKYSTLIHFFSKKYTLAQFLLSGLFYFFTYFLNFSQYIYMCIYLFSKYLLYDVCFVPDADVGQ